MFGLSAERNEVERPARIDSGGTPRRICGTIFVRYCLRSKPLSFYCIINAIFLIRIMLFPITVCKPVDRVINIRIMIYKIICNDHLRFRAFVLPTVSDRPVRFPAPAHRIHIHGHGKAAHFQQSGQAIPYPVKIPLKRDFSFLSENGFSDA